MYSNQSLGPVRRPARQYANECVITFWFFSRTYLHNKGQARHIIIIRWCTKNRREKTVRFRWWGYGFIGGETATTRTTAAAEKKQRDTADRGVTAHAPMLIMA